MRECEWSFRLRTDPLTSQFVTHYRGTLIRPPKSLALRNILRGFQNGELFGFALVDISVPSHLKEHFKEFPPIFKNTVISREDIGEHMKQYATDNDLLSSPTRYLISSYKGDKILLASPLLKWYLDNGLEVSYIHKLILYEPKQCFKTFGEKVTFERRKGNINAKSQILADNWKLQVISTCFRPP